MPAHRDPANKGKAAPLIRSSVFLRGLATAITLTSLGGMTSFAATHVQNTAAPLQPPASTTTAVTPAATAAPAATAPSATGKSSTTTTRRSTTITGATTTTTTARTKTKSS
jgi:hypothetical protein